MFDLSREIRNWRTPFQASCLYSTGDLKELEGHLLDTIESEVLAGASEEDAFWTALSRVGDEPVLRSQYELGWRELGWVRRFWRLLTGETAAFKTRGRRVRYSLARIVSLLVGLIAPVYLLAAAVFVFSGFKIIEFGRPVYEQGVFFTLLLGVQGLFNWIPFRTWRNSIADWLRVSVSGVSIVVAAVFLIYHPDTYSGLSGFLSVLAISTAFSIGPLLWVLQATARSQLLADYDELLFRSD